MEIFVSSKLKEGDFNFIANRLREGDLVVIPTETVYGIAVNIFNDESVDRLFKLKKRDKNKPITIHVSSEQDIYNLADVNKYAKILINEFLPGPLTIIMKKRYNMSLPNCVVKNNKIAIRFPDNDVALKIIKKTDTYIAATSANISGKPSATKVEDVIKYFGHKNLDLIVDDGPTKYGMDSTIIDTTVDPPKIVRIGALEINKIKDLIGSVKF